MLSITSLLRWLVVICYRLHVFGGKFLNNLLDGIICIKIVYILEFAFLRNGIGMISEFLLTENSGDFVNKN